MNCPNCGTETNEAVCPICGANVGANPGSPKKSKGGLIAAIVAAIIVIAAAASVLIFVVFGGNGEKKSKEVIDTFMTGLAEADSDKIASVVDPDCMNEDDFQNMVDSFELLKSMGIEYTFDYNIESIDKASDSEITSMCSGLYQDEEGAAKKIKSAYICNVTYTISITFMDQTESESDTFNIICYKKDRSWYVGGSMTDL